MTSSIQANVEPSKGRRRAGGIMTGIVVLLLLFDSFGKLMQAAQVVDASIQLGYPESSVRIIGIILLVCVVVYAIPRTSVLGAILLTGYLGGAVATNLRVGNPIFTHILFPIYVAVLVWGGIYLREPRLATLVPLRR
ncbi:MAG: DoxX family protein [Gemmatimonadales bacterium]